MIAEDPVLAQNIVTRFADLMRYSLQSSQRREVPLREEIQAVENYLACEKIRFEERLHIDWSLAPEAMDVMLPPMIVQTLVENGVKHGISQLSKGGLIRIGTVMQTSRLHLEVHSSGPWLPANGSGTHTGIANARAHLNGLYGSAATLEFQKDDDRVVARLSIPSRLTAVS